MESPHTDWTTDTTGNSQLGYGAILEKHWAFFHWPAQWKRSELIRDITFL
jgi:hypothetical protein